jgi:hypothetical protein
VRPVLLANDDLRVVFRFVPDSRAGDAATPLHQSLDDRVFAGARTFGLVSYGEIEAMKIFAATALALALSATPASGASPTGLRGVVLVDPAYPVCQIGQPCTAPAKHVWLVFSRRGRAVARTRTASDGSYRIALAPGAFAVSSPHHTLSRGLQPRRVVVRLRGYRRVDFRLDIGIR